MARFKVVLKYREKEERGERSGVGEVGPKARK